MNNEYPYVSDDFDPALAIATSDGLTFKLEVLIASLSGRILGALCTLLVLAYATLSATSFLYFAPSSTEIGTAARSLMPSLLVILLFAVASTAHYTLTLSVTRRQAQVALKRQMLAHKRVEEDLAEGFSN